MILQVSGVLLVAPTASSLEARRKEFLKNMKEVSQVCISFLMLYMDFFLQVISLSKDQRATSQAISSSLDQVKQEALQLRSQICEELMMVEGRCDTSTSDQVNNFPPRL